MNILKNKKIVAFVLVFVLLITVAGIICIVKFSKGSEFEQHRVLANAYGEYYIKDNPEKQYMLLDLSVIEGVKTASGYIKKPLDKENYSVEVVLTKKASESNINQLNRAYENIFPDINFVVEKAWRYNVKLHNISKNSNDYIVGFWVVETGGHLTICTIYDYDRSMDRCIEAKMY